MGNGVAPSGVDVGIAMVFIRCKSCGQPVVNIYWSDVLLWIAASFVLRYLRSLPS